MPRPIVVIGSSNTDMIVQLDRIPAPGETVLGGRFSTAAGGKGANQAVAAARAGGQVVFVARVGSDSFGNQALAGFATDGIDTRFVFRDSSVASGIACIFVDRNGQNSIAVASGANMRLTPGDIAAAEDAIAQASVVLLQLEIPLETVVAAVDIASAHRVPVILNPAPAQSLPDGLLAKVSILTPNEIEAGMLTGISVTDEISAKAAAQILRSRGVAAVIITLGDRGSLLSGCDHAAMIPAFKVKPVDATAAGDVFNGALAVRLSEGHSIEDAVQFASAAAAISVTRLGAQPSAPRRKEIEEFLGK
ncbi:MAG: ribokinase [Phycisphaerae bacterium]|nr:ribokinase [Phycisphaerae bacterium]